MLGFLCIVPKNNNTVNTASAPTRAPFIPYESAEFSRMIITIRPLYYVLPNRLPEGLDFLLPEPEINIQPETSPFFCLATGL